VPISKRNRRGVLLLSAILLVIIYSPRILAGLTKNKHLKYSIEELDLVEKEVLESRTTKKNLTINSKKSRFVRPKKKFDPNCYTKSEWISLGLSEKQADVVLRFTEHGVDSNDDLQKIFVISDELFELIKDSTYYPSKIDRQGELNSKEQLVTIDKFIVDLNTATNEELIKLVGIGDYYAEKIIEYRNRLGGYNRPEQLLDLWKFTPEKLEKIREQIVISGNVRKLNINLINYDDLVKHPYITGKIANSIVKMREQRKVYKKMEELLDSKLIDRELFDKLKPYLKI
jgi:competence ComEA-like helix-hairpin-helix protein